MPSTRLKIPHPARSRPTMLRQVARYPADSVRHSAKTPTATKTQVLRWNRPSHRVLSSSEPTLVTRGGDGLPESVSMWGQCRIWCNTDPSKKSAEPEPEQDARDGEP